jgi:hypothetical protein
MKKQAGVRKILATANLLLLLLAVYREQTELETKALAHQLKHHSLELSRFFWMKIRAKMNEKAAVVFSRATAAKRFIPVKSTGDLYVARPGSELVGLQQESIKMLSRDTAYFFIEEEDFPLMNVFVENGFRAIMQLEATNLALTQKDYEMYREIHRVCERATCEIETQLGDLEVRIRDRRQMREIYFCHREVGGVCLTKYWQECEFLERLKDHFKKFVGSVGQSRDVFEFIDSYARSLLLFLYEAGVLKILPDTAEYPELLSVLMPFRVAALKAYLRNEEPIVGGLAFEAVRDSAFLAPLFDMERVEGLCETGGRFIFTAWISREGSAWRTIFFS